jgi:hypothetical protein
MASIVELTTSETNTFITGAWYPSANSNSMLALDYTVSSWQTGSWGGLMNTFGANSGVDIGTLESGSWGGLMNTWGAHEILSESQDRTSAVSDQNPTTNQGVGSGEWDVFPAPPEEPEPELPQRDLTRFKKTYSSQRHQPQRVRLVRR